MKYSFLFLLIAFLNVNIYSQVINSTESLDSTNVYYQSFRLFAEKLNWSESILLVEENNLTSRSIPNKINGFSIDIIDYEQLIEKLTKGSVNIIRIVPIRLKDDEFFVSIIVFKVTKTKKQVSFINSGGALIIYTYNGGSFSFKEIR